MEQAISNFGGNLCGCNTDPVYIAMKGDMDEATFFATSFPVEVYSVEGELIGIAYDKQEFISLWNSNDDNRAIGLLGDLVGPFSYQLYLNDGQEAPDHVRGMDGWIDFAWDGPEDRSITLIFADDPTEDIVIVWGDGDINTIPFADASDPIEHVYPEARQYEVKILTKGQTVEIVSLNGDQLTTFAIARMTFATNLDISHNQLATLGVSHLPSDITSLIANDNNLPSSVVDTILEKLDEFDVSDGTVDLSNQTPAAVPGSAGLTAKTNLEGKGWSVTVDS